MKAVAKLAAFELTTREDVACAAEIEIRARLLVTTGGLIIEVVEDPIKTMLENVVGNCVTMCPRGKAKEVAE